MLLFNMQQHVAALLLLLLLQGNTRFPNHMRGIYMKDHTYTTHHLITKLMQSHD